MKIIWTHSFDQEISKSAGVFMFQQLPYIKKGGFNVDLLYFKKPSKFFRFLRYFIQNRNKYKKDILHAQYGSGCGYLTSLLRAKKKILTLRGSDWYQLRKGPIGGIIHSFIARRATILSLNRYDEIVVMSNRMKSEILNKFPRFKKPIHVIPDFIDISKFKPIKKETAKNEVLKLIEADSSKKWILYSSVLSKNPIKQANLAHEAILLVKKVIKDLELIEMTNVPFEKVPFFINSCELVLLTSSHEGYPNIIKESLACNVPFVSTDVSDLLEIAKDSSSGCYVSHSNPQSIADSIIKVLKEKNKSYVHSKFVESMDFSNISNTIIPLYRI
ncbi:MAG: glycosyltransferase family 4 protein [Bacteroidetes bacterium]|nr:glycosyltransferase family 4 protein [Bacteroidota bacterium]